MLEVTFQERVSLWKIRGRQCLLDQFNSMHVVPQSRALWDGAREERSCILP